MDGKRCALMTGFDARRMPPVGAARGPDGAASGWGAPLRLITTIGVLVSAGSFGVAAWALWLRLFTSDAVPGWTSTVVPMYFLGGVQLLCIGIIGEYLAKIYLEVNRRPAYFVEKRVGGETAAAAVAPCAQCDERGPGDNAA